MTNNSLSDEMLSIKQLSEYLMVSEKTIYRMLEKRSLPAIRIGGQWRFRKKDMDEWIDHRIRKVDEGDRQGLADLGPSEIAITPLLQRENIWINVPPLSREEILHWMVAQATMDPGVDRQALVDSIVEREKTCSTALISDAAFPHLNDPAKFQFSRKRVLVAVLQNPVRWNDPHGHQPRIIVMILARRVQGYLLTISRAIKLFGDPDLITRLSESKSPEDVIAAIRRAEERL